MPQVNYARCKDCGRHRDEVGPMSWTRLCSECAERRFHANADDLYYHRGPNFKKWRRGMAASVGGLLIDDVLDPEE